LAGDLTAVVVGAQEERKSKPIPKRRPAGMILVIIWCHFVWAWELPEENMSAPAENMSTRIKVCETQLV